MYLQIRKLRHREVKLLEITQLVRAGAGGGPGTAQRRPPQGFKQGALPRALPLPGCTGPASCGLWWLLPDPGWDCNQCGQVPSPLPYSKFLKVQAASLTPFWPLQLLLGTEKRLQQGPLG